MLTRSPASRWVRRCRRAPGPPPPPLQYQPHVGQQRRWSALPVPRQLLCAPSNPSAECSTHRRWVLTGGWRGLQTEGGAARGGGSDGNRGEDDALAPPAVLVDRVLYRGRWILPMRFCLRMKLLQMAGAAAAANCLFVEPDVSSDVLIAGSLFTGIVGLSVSLWYFSRAYVGELRFQSTAPEGDASEGGGGVSPESWLVVSTLDFWGNRRERAVEMDQWGTPLAGLSAGQVADARKKPFVAVDIAPPTPPYHSDIVFVSLSSQHARFPAGVASFEKLLTGEWGDAS